VYVAETAGRWHHQHLVAAANADSLIIYTVTFDKLVSETATAADTRYISQQCGGLLVFSRDPHPTIPMGTLQLHDTSTTTDSTTNASTVSTASSACTIGTDTGMGSPVTLLWWTGCSSIPPPGFHIITPSHAAPCACYMMLQYYHANIWEGTDVQKDIVDGAGSKSFQHVFTAVRTACLKQS
jgi:hypothetical protein